MMYDSFHAHIEEKDQTDAIASCMTETIHIHVSENDRGIPGIGRGELGVVLVGNQRQAATMAISPSKRSAGPARPRRSHQASGVTSSPMRWNCVRKG